MGAGTSLLEVIAGIVSYGVIACLIIIISINMIIISIIIIISVIGMLIGLAIAILMSTAVKMVGVGVVVGMSLVSARVTNDEAIMCVFIGLISTYRRKEYC